MATVKKQAANNLNPVYKQAAQGIQGLMPGAEGVYNQLVQALQGQAQVQQQNVLQGAQNAGVTAPTLAGQVQAQLGGALDLGQAQLGVANAQNISTLQQALGQNRVSRAQYTQQLADTLATGRRNVTQANLERQQQNRNYQLDVQNANRDFKLAQVAEARRQAEAAAAAREAAARSAASQQAQLEAAFFSASPDKLARMIRQSWKKNGSVGSDKYVAPKTLAKAYNTWTQVAGRDPASFWTYFQGKWNPKQASYNKEFTYYVNKGV